MIQLESTDSNGRKCVIVGFCRKDVEKLIRSSRSMTMEVKKLQESLGIDYTIMIIFRETEDELHKFGHPEMHN